MPNPPTVPDLEFFPFFRGLPPELLQKWQVNLKCKRFAKRQRLIFPSNYQDVIFFLSTGKVKIAYYSEDGKEFTITILSAGEVYSQHSLAVATALENTEILYLSMADFRIMLDECPELARRLVGVLGQILRLTNDLILDLAFREAASRLARVFRRTGRNKSIDAGKREGILTGKEKIQNTFYLTHEELASLSGTTRQTVNEILRHWEQQGIVELHRGHVVLLQPERLWDKISQD